MNSRRLVRIAKRVLAEAVPDKLYHASPFADKIKREGFKYGENKMFGGGRYFSFTTKQNVKLYSDALKDVISAISGDVSLDEMPEFVKKWGGQSALKEFRDEAINRGYIDSFRLITRFPLYSREWFVDYMDSVFLGKRPPEDPVDEVPDSILRSPDFGPRFTKQEEAEIMANIVISLANDSRNKMPAIIGGASSRFSQLDANDVKVVEVTLKPDTRTTYHSTEKEWRVYEPDNINVEKVLRM